MGPTQCASRCSGGHNIQSSQLTTVTKRPKMIINILKGDWTGDLR